MEKSSSVSSKSALQTVVKLRHPILIFAEHFGQNFGWVSI